jgi:hypothetical protein
MVVRMSLRRNMRQMEDENWLKHLVADPSLGSGRMTEHRIG